MANTSALMPNWQWRWIALSDKLMSLNRIVYPIVTPNPPFLPVLQIYDITPCNSDTDTQFRLTLADGYNLQRAVLAPELSNMVQDMMVVIKPGSIERILDYTLYANFHQEMKRLIMIDQMEVLMTDFGPIIGWPVDTFTSNVYYPGRDQIEWYEPEDWKEHNWGWLDPDDPDFPWLEDEGRGQEELKLWDFVAD